MFLCPCQEYWRGGNFLSCTLEGGWGGEFSPFQTSFDSVIVKRPLGWDCSVSRVSDGKAQHNRHAHLMRLSQAGRGCFPPGLTSVQTFSPCWHSPHVQSHASASVQVLANPKHWQPSSLLDWWTKMWHTLVGMGGSAHVAAADVTE